jgi:hypothetical protein
MPSHEEILDVTLVAQAVIWIGYTISALVVISNNYAGFNGFLTALMFGGGIYLTHWSIKHISRTLYGILLGMVSVMVFVSLESAIFWGQYGSCAHYSTKDDSSPPTMKPTEMPVEDEGRRALLFEEYQIKEHDALQVGVSSAMSSVISLLFSTLSSQPESDYSSLSSSRVLNSSYISDQCSSQGAMKSVCAFSVFMFLSYLVLGAILVHYKNAILGTAPLNEGYDVVGGGIKTSVAPK